MRKIFLCTLLLLSIGVFSKPYDHSLGVSMGTNDGLSYKTLLTENFAVQTDVGFHLTVFDGLFGMFTVNPMFMYQGVMYSNSVCDIDWFVGGGTSLGFATPYLGYYDSHRWAIGGEFGLNAITGFEFAFNSAPLALSFDFRPGYGLYYGDVYYYSSSSSSYHSYYEELSYFDWGIVLGLRFYL